MKTTISTIYGAYLQACQFFKRPFVLVPNTTLNEKLGIQSGVTPAATEMPNVGWLCIGKQGHRQVTGGDGQEYTVSNQHQPSDAGLYSMLPFAARKLSNDFTVQERAKYAGRKIEELNGENYAVYYLMKLDMSNAAPTMTVNTKVDGVISSKPFVPTSANLSPTPPVLNNGQTLTASGEYLAIKSVVDVVLSATQIEQIIEACRIKWDNEGYAIISELGLVSGVERQVSGTAAGNNSVQYTEVIAAQIVGILNTYHSLPFANTQIKETMTLGTADPMLLNTGLTTS